MTPQEIRALRLKNDYEEMVNIKGDIFSWIPLRGVAPYVEEYEVTIHVKGITNNIPTYRDVHVVKVTLPANYPSAPPDIYMTSLPVVYHPNWFKAGKWCYGNWAMSEGLGHHVLRMVRTIQYDTEITNENSPAHTEANDWYLSRKRSGLFPTDKKQLPDPTKKRFNIAPTGKKKFEIK